MGTNSEQRTDAPVPDHASSDVRSELKEPHALLEKAFIDEFLATRGYTVRTVNRLPPGDREALLRAASRFASLKLAAVEARAHLLGHISGRD